MAAPRISALIPTWNGARDLARLLPVLAAQRVDGGFEIRAIDSDSDDDTRAMLERAGAHVERIDRARFQHGATRNELARGAHGEILVFLSQDALPRGDDLLATLCRAFDAPNVGGAFARILPHEGCDPLSRPMASLDTPQSSAQMSRGYVDVSEEAAAIRPRHHRHPLVRPSARRLDDAVALRSTSDRRCRDQVRDPG